MQWSFIFSLKNGTIQNSILSCVIYSEYAINCYSNHGPRFGGGCDLAILDNFKKRIKNDSTFNNSGSLWFSVEEYEIFQIVKA